MEISLRYGLSQTVRAEMFRECSTPTTCHMSHVTCHMSQVTIHIFLYFLTKSWIKLVEGLLSMGPTQLWWRIFGDKEEDKTLQQIFCDEKQLFMKFVGNNNFFDEICFQWKEKSWKKLKLWQNSKTKIVTKLKNPLKTQIIKTQNSKTQIVTKLKNPNCYKTQKFKCGET